MRLVRYTYPTYPNSRRVAPVWGVAARSPWSGLETEMDRLFENALGAFAGSTSQHRLPADLFEDKNNTYVRADLPGVNRDDIKVEVADGYLTINAKRTTPAAEGQPETSYTFSRSIALNDTVATDQVGAAYENGVLTVTLPKREEAKPKKITVAVK
jgi:HSP20 family protein